MFVDVIRIKRDKREITRYIVTKLRKIYSPRVVGESCYYILRYRSPFIGFLAFMRDKYGRIYVPLKLVPLYRLFSIVTTIMKNLVEFKDNLLYHRQAILLDKLVFNEITLNGNRVPVEKVSIEKLGVVPLRVIVKSVIPQRYSNYLPHEREYLPLLVKAKYLVRDSRGSTTYYYSTRQAFVEAVKRLRNPWYNFKCTVLGYLLDLALLQYGNDLVISKYVIHKSVTRDDIERLLRVYNTFKNLPVKIVEDEYIGELLRIALEHPEQIVYL